MRLISWLLFALVLSAGACGPTPLGHDGGTGGDDDDDDDIDARGFPPDTRFGMVTGTVWAPGNAPGMVPDGQEIPIAGAIVFTTPLTSPPPDIKQKAYCDPCQDHPTNAVVSDAKGHFTLRSPVGQRLLVIQKAQFRLVQTIGVGEELPTVLDTPETTLPSKHDPANGKWIPKIALAVADSDHAEDIFGKMGLVDVDASGATIAASFDDTDHLDLYGAIEHEPTDPEDSDPGPPPFASKQKGSIEELFSDVEKMKEYHLILVPCNYDSDVSILNRPAVRKNIQDYIAEGGKLYVTDWSAEWEDAAFPDFISFDSTMDTTAAMAASNSVNIGDGDFGHFAEHGTADDPGLNAWLDGQKGPLVIPLGGEGSGPNGEDFPSRYEDGTINANDFVIEGSWTLIRSLPTVRIGTDEDGAAINETAKAWISGEFQGSRYPHTVTFEPSCGRVLYSTYHTAEQTHKGLVPQERVLLYLLMEIGVCTDGPIID